MRDAAEDEIQFPVGSVQLEFHVGVTKAGEGTAGAKFWVVELGGKGSYAFESIQKVTVNLEPLWIGVANRSRWRD
jgi:Trypsin-co-occurring domain 2